MSQTRFTKDHEWVRLDGDVATIGITDHAQQALGDVVFVELPQAGQQVTAGEAGTVTDRNEAVVDDPALVNSAPTEGGWFFKMELQDPATFDSLMDEAEYQA